MLNTTDLGAVIGSTVHDIDGDEIGTVGQVYVHPDTDEPTWVSIKTGLFGTSESFAPLDDASFDGSALTVRYRKEFVKDAPRVEDDGALDDAEEDALYAYYGDRSGAAHDSAAPAASGTTRMDTGRDTSGPTTDDAMTRSEERLRVGTEKVRSGSARLKKFIVSEQQTVNVRVSHEEARLVREPITTANRGAATDGVELSEGVHEVVLSAEQVVVDKDVVPVERISLGKETVTEQRTVTEDVRKEEIELIDPDGVTGSRDRA